MAGRKPEDEPTNRRGQRQMTEYTKEGREEFAWSQDLLCYWVSWAPFDTDTLLLKLPALSVCDMTGCIRVAKAIMPSVRVIEVMSGLVPDVRYERDKHGAWQCTDRTTLAAARMQDWTKQSPPDGLM